jgi:hypothetical protein
MLDDGEEKPMARYSITSIDNSSIGAGGSSSKRGEFDDADSALARAEQLVDGALAHLLPTTGSAHELMAHYMVRGSEVPMIYGEPRVAFHAFQYARTRATALFSTAPRTTPTFGADAAKSEPQESPSVPSPAV